MATIEQDLAQIRQAVYGEEVREAIADGIEQCYQDSTANGQIDRIIAKGQETYDSIPEDYSGLSDEVSYLNSALSSSYKVAESIDIGNLVESGQLNPETGANMSNSATTTRTNYVVCNVPTMIKMDSSDYLFCGWAYTTNSASGAATSITGRAYTGGGAIIVPQGGTNTFRIGIQRVDGSALQQT